MPKKAAQIITEKIVNLLNLTQRRLSLKRESLKSPEDSRVGKKKAVTLPAMEASWMCCLMLS